MFWILRFPFFAFLHFPLLSVESNPSNQLILGPLTQVVVSNKKNRLQGEDDYRTMTTIDNGDLLRGPPLPEAEPGARGWFVHRLIALAQEELDSTGDR